MDRKKRVLFGLLVSVAMSLLMNVIFLIIFKQSFEWGNWLSQLPLTIPVGAFTGAMTGMLIAKKLPNISKWQSNIVFSLTMSFAMSCIMAPWALIPRMGFDLKIISQGIGMGIPIGFVVASLVGPVCVFIVYGKAGMPERINSTGD